MISSDTFMKDILTMNTEGIIPTIYLYVNNIDNIVSVSGFHHRKR